MILSITVYGGEAEGGIGATDAAPWLMALMGLSGVYLSCRYLYVRLISAQKIQKSLIDIVIVLPALFMACIQLYAAFLFFAGI